MFISVLPCHRFAGCLGCPKNGERRWSGKGEPASPYREERQLAAGLFARGESSTSPAVLQRRSWSYSYLERKSTAHAHTGPGLGKRERRSSLGRASLQPSADRTALSSTPRYPHRVSLALFAAVLVATARAEPERAPAGRGSGG